MNARCSFALHRKTLAWKGCSFRNFHKLLGCCSFVSCALCMVKGLAPDECLLAKFFSVSPLIVASSLCSLDCRPLINDRNDVHGFLTVKAGNSCLNCRQCQHTFKVTQRWLICNLLYATTLAASSLRHVASFHGILGSRPKKNQSIHLPLRTALGAVHGCHTVQESLEILL